MVLLAPPQRLAHKLFKPVLTHGQLALILVRGIYEKNLTENVKVHVTAGVDKGSNLTGFVRMVGLTARF
jgi:hypothetical protein